MCGSNFYETDVMYFIFFVTSLEILQQLKTTVKAFEKLEVLVETFKEINEIGQEAGFYSCFMFIINED